MTSLQPWLGCVRRIPMLNVRSNGRPWLRSSRIMAASISVMPCPYRSTTDCCVLRRAHSWIVSCCILLLEHWDSLEQRFGVSIGLREFAYICSRDDRSSAEVRSFLAATLPAAAIGRVSVIAAYLFAVASKRSVPPKALQSYSPYRLGRSTDPAMVRHLLLAGIEPLRSPSPTGEITPRCLREQRLRSPGRRGPTDEPSPEGNRRSDSDASRHSSA